MKRIITVSACLLLCMICLGQEGKGRTWRRMAGIDLCAAASEQELEFVISQQFFQHWSIDTQCSTHLTQAKRRYSSEEEEHYRTLNYISYGDEENVINSMNSRITISYWMEEAYYGFFLRAGCKCGIAQRPACIIGSGYTIKLWKELRCSLTFDTTVDKQRKSELGFTISYVMK